MRHEHEPEEPEFTPVEEPEEGTAGRTSDAPPGPGADGADGEDAGESEPGPEPNGEQEADAVAELRERWQRALADLDNLRKRHVREMERERAVERARTAAALLPLIDHLELALEHAEADPDSIVEGVRAVRDEAVGAFEKLGYPRHDESGVPFDPSRHEAVGTVEDDGADPGLVHEVLRPGYGDGAAQLRPAAVTVTSRQE
ncbi:molecular chaperone GrpE [Streptomyces sp. Amel2xB2]|uniref:nucleotide exchange factor GrpE n=1 Tax=Streptomyces sp. Amel2xB2 TaxID=1305829 RepID=UPI000DBAD004|nr:nucleotide exchange factor GrpE [Streptomyces sp. Amel2xB2]RAJ71297.1 molecular chaperone GrpE [Streptomyces sp. Amel2xB2]